MCMVLFIDLYTFICIISVAVLALAVISESQANYLQSCAYGVYNLFGSVLWDHSQLLIIVEILHSHATHVLKHLQLKALSSMT